MGCITLDGRKMQNKELAHIYLKSALNLDEHYGHNLDALWDILSTYHQSLEIHLIHRDEMMEQLGSYGELLLNVFEDAAMENSWIIFKS